MRDTIASLLREITIEHLERDNDSYLAQGTLKAIPQRRYPKALPFTPARNAANQTPPIQPATGGAACRRGVYPKGFTLYPGTKRCKSDSPHTTSDGGAACRRGVYPKGFTLKALPFTPARNAANQTPPIQPATAALHAGAAFTLKVWHETDSHGVAACRSGVYPKGFTLCPGTKRCKFFPSLFWEDNHLRASSPGKIW